MDNIGILNVGRIIILVLIFYVGGTLILLFGLCMAAKKGDRKSDRALAEIKKAVNNTWKYDCTETTTSGCPVNHEE